jgi:hypothetical protein
MILLVTRADKAAAPLEGANVVVTVDVVVLIMDLLKEMEVPQGNGVPTLTTHEVGDDEDLQALIKTDHHVVVVEVTMMKH